MRKVSLMLVAILLLVSTVGFANDGIESDPSKELQVQVKNLLDGRFKMSNKKQFDATVVFTVNKKSEIVVLSVKSVDKNFCVFVKNNLNYKEVKVDGAVEGRRYTIPVTVQT